MRARVRFTPERAQANRALVLTCGETSPDRGGAKIIKVGNVPAGAAGDLDVHAAIN